jgi:hypothetical protein
VAEAAAEAVGLASDDGMDEVIHLPAGGGFTMGGPTGQGDLAAVSVCGAPIYGAGAFWAGVHRGRLLIFA